MEKHAFSLPSYVTCWLRFAQCPADGRWDITMQRLLEKLDRRGKLNWDEEFADGTFASAEKGAISSAKPSEAKDHGIGRRHGLPIAIDIESASPSEVKLIERLIDKAATEFVPNKLFYDKAADSDKLRNSLADRGIELFCLHRKRRVRKPTQDGRALRCYRGRWKVERTISWLYGSRRLVTRCQGDVPLVVKTLTRSHG